MKNILILIGVFLFLTSCSEKTGTENESESDSTEVAIDASATLATPLSTAQDPKVWLTEVIEGYFSSNSYPEEKITTPSYYEYKMDAINVDMDGGLTKDQFIAKWKNNYNPEKAGIGTGFFISGQDFGTVKVNKCELAEATEENGWLLNVELTDTDFNATYNRQFVLIRNGNSFLIDDVIENN